MAKPYSDRGEFDEGEVVFGVFFVSCGDGSEVFDFTEEALDLIAIYLCTKRAAQYLSMSKRKLENWRQMGTGPVFHKTGRKRVFYH